MSSNIGEIGQPEYRSSVIQDIYDVMTQRPHEIALTDGSLELTYADLRRRSDIIAKSLSNHGVDRGSVVGMHLARCADAIAVMLGIMISGCTYLPLDPSYPPARLQFMLDQAGAVAVISNDSDPDLYGAHRIWLPSPSQRSLELAASASEPCRCPAERATIEPQDCAYILFTSGSTGDPKGVMVTHKNITLMNEWSARVLGLTSSDSSATTCSLSFDASFHETLLPLSVGGTVHVIPHALALGELTRSVSLVATTLTVANELLRSGQLPPLKVLMLGGESLSSDVAVRLLASGRVGRLLNCYGPTECTVCVTVADVTAPVPEVVPIGRSVPGTEVLILNENGDQLPDGEIGEIFVFGNQVTLGYVNDPVETAERFGIGPAVIAGSQRYYRTGDLGYRTDTGVVYFAGRADRQVKINGIRIELGEIETVLRSHPQISEATTLVRDDGRTVAYAVPIKDDVDIDIADLRKYLTLSLPRFMVPAGIMIIAELPITVNGKLDTSALPEWSPGRPETEPLVSENIDEFTARVIEVAANVTGFAGQIRSSDDFIDNLGGNSLGIVRLLAELERYSGRRIRINEALADTSVAGLAGLFREDTVNTPADFAFNIDGDSPPLFLIHAYLGGMLGLRRMAELLPKNQPVYGLHVYSDADQPYKELTISALAESALTRIREIQPAGQVAIVGHSAGGLIAFEAARMILESGNPEPLVMLMDAPRPYNAFGYLWGELMLHWRQMIRDAVRKPRKAAAGLFHVARPENTVPEITAEPGDLMAQAERHSRAIESAIKSWKAQTYKGSITLMRTRQGRAMALGRPYLGWASVTQGALKIIVVTGGHLNMLDAPYLHNVTEELTNWLSEA